MPRFNITEFIAQTKVRGLAHPSRFEVFVQNPAATAEEDRLISLFCESTGFPELNIQTKPFRMFGPSHQMPAVVEYGGSGFLMTFLLDKDFLVKRYFDSWMHMVHMPGFFNLNYREVYVRNILITQLDRADNESYSMRLWQAFPRHMQLIELNNGAKDTISKLQVVFAFRYWETDQIQHNVVSGRAPSTTQDPNFIPSANEELNPANPYQDNGNYGSIGGPGASAYGRGFAGFPTPGNAGGNNFATGAIGAVEGAFQGAVNTVLQQAQSQAFNAAQRAVAGIQNSALNALGGLF
jgi:hypothetical protein